MMLGVIALLAVTAPLCSSSLEQNRQAIRKALDLAERDEENFERFLFLRRREVREYDASGRLKSREAETVRRRLFAGQVLQLVVARDDRPLSPQEQAAQEQRLAEHIAAHRDQTARQLLRSKARRGGEDRAFLRELPDALDYELQGTETVLARRTLVYSFRPRPGYTPRSLKARMFEKVRGTAWIDQATGQMVKVDAEVFDTVNVGLGLAGKIGKGTRFFLQRREVAPGVWLVERQSIRLDLRILLVKALRREVEVLYSEFQPLPASDSPAEP